MKYIFYGLLLLTSIYSCGKKDRFECGLQNQMAPADDSGRIFVPTAFSPNGDGINDVFSPRCVEVESIDFNIYDSDNKLLYHTGELNAGWAGDMNVEKGIRLYHYKLEATTKKDNKISKCGNFYIYKCLPDGFDCKQLIFGDQFDPSFPDGYLNSTSREIFLPCK